MRRWLRYPAMPRQVRTSKAWHTWILSILFTCKWRIWGEEFCDSVSHGFLDLCFLWSGVLSHLNAAITNLIQGMPAALELPSAQSPQKLSLLWPGNSGSTAVWKSRCLRGNDVQPPWIYSFDDWQFGWIMLVFSDLSCVRQMGHKRDNNLRHGHFNPKCLGTWGVWGYHSRILREETPLNIVGHPAGPPFPMALRDAKEQGHLMRKGSEIYKKSTAWHIQLWRCEI